MGGAVMAITVKMWEESIKKHYEVLLMLEKRNDLDDKFHIKEHKKAIKEIYSEIDKIIITNTDIHFNKTEGVL